MANSVKRVNLVKEKFEMKLIVEELLIDKHKLFTNRVLQANYGGPR